jgi:hypothetical protein
MVLLEAFHSYNKQQSKLAAGPKDLMAYKADERLKKNISRS